ncbi:MAG: GNAT family N-acetyltransferase [Gemmatimonadaceae bacterium]|nr:GNAT family N-acetyltransferase [Gemmatimonadaceae bacterium]
MRRRHATASTTPTGLVVRAADPADLEIVVALRLRLLAEEARNPAVALSLTDLHEHARQLSERQLASPTDVIFLATQRDAALGMLRVAVSRPPRLVRPQPYGFMTSAYVVPSYRRAGVLRALVRAGEAWCRARGLGEVRLHCTVDNAPGNASWEALGYGVAELVRRRTLTEE